MGFSLSAMARSLPFAHLARGATRARQDVSGRSFTITRTAHDQTHHKAISHPSSYRRSQYERLALAAFHLCDRQGQQLQHLITLATSMFRSPPVTIEERHEHGNLLELMILIGQRTRQRFSLTLRKA